MISSQCEMLGITVSTMVELRLLLACARVATTGADEAAIRGILAEGVDWTVFTRQAVDHGLASLAGHTLARVAPDAVPEELLDAFRAMVEQTRRSNSARFEELAEIVASLSRQGIEAIPFKGPMLALHAYGDLGLRVFRDLDFLIRDGDLGATIATLDGFGYARRPGLTAAQFARIHWLQGQEIILKRGGEGAIEPHTRLISVKLALDIDYAGLWRRAERMEVRGHSLLGLAPEDELLVLAIHGGKELWWSMKWACDFAVFVGARPRLDWRVAIARARAQGCLRMVLLAAALARRFFAAAVPDWVAAAERSDPVIAAMVERILARWQAGEPGGPPGSKTLSMEQLRLHDRLAQRASYVARTVFLPGPEHVAAMPLPRGLGFAYVPIKVGHDFVALPLWRAYRHVIERAGRIPYALAGSALALALMPASAETKRSIRLHQQARANAERALARDPNNVTAWHKLGDALSALKRPKQAIACYDKALALAPYNTVIWKKRTIALEASGETAQPANPASEDRDAKAWGVQANRLFSSRQFSEAIDASDRALELDPETIDAARIGIQARLFACDWDRREADKRRISEGAAAGRRIITPFYHRTISDSEAEHLVLAKIWAKGLLRAPTAQGRHNRHGSGKIRIAYMSTDFRSHVVSDMIAGCFEHHDKTRFETTAISLGPDDGSAMRRRIEAAFDRFVDVGTMSDLNIASTVRELGIDILIDLNGNSGEQRTGILSHRPAPVQVIYLGYPGTMGLPFIDYIIADRVVIPEENLVHYSEQVVYLPHTHMPTDRMRPIAPTTPSRAEAGLPETGFVFACHNHEHKIAPEVFDVWMRLLRACEGSILWLKALNSAAVINLRRQAKNRGVAPDRLIFAPNEPLPENHLARLRLADLFLDTLPYNAHATACDALWAGLPVLTCAGNAFPGRVAASVLHAVGLPEMVTASLADYEALAIMLARNPERLAAIRAKLLRNRDTEPLFDTARFTRDLESAYTRMWERYLATSPAATFVVEPSA